MVVKTCNPIKQKFLELEYDDIRWVIGKDMDHCPVFHHDQEVPGNRKHEKFDERLDKRCDLQKYFFLG